MAVAVLVGIVANVLIVVSVVCFCCYFYCWSVLSCLLTEGYRKAYQCETNYELMQDTIKNVLGISYKRDR